MKQIIFLVGLFFSISTVGVNASEGFSLDTTNNQFDTIIKVEGKVMVGDVTKVSPSYISFILPGHDESYRLPRKEIHKIIYKNGRIEEFSAMVMIEISEDAYQAVWITEDKQDVADLHKRGNIKAQAQPSYRSKKAAKNNAIIRIQKKAVALQATVVLITKKQTTGGYGEMQGYYMEGIAYGTEPLTDDELEDK